MHSGREHTGLTQALVLLVLLGGTFTGCGPGGGTMGGDADAGMTTDAVADAGFRVLPPNIDWLEAGVPPIASPSWTPCPEGWREVIAEEGEPVAVTCAPYPEGGPEECADGWAHFMGELGCTPVGAPCPTGDFPEGLPSDSPVLYVLAGASAGGDGSEGAPFASVAMAMALASSGTVIALGKGTYDEAVNLAAGVTLWGACAAETRLTTSSPVSSVRGVVEVFAADTRLQNVRIGPAEIPGLAVVGSSAAVTATGVLIEGARSVGLLVREGGRVHGRTLCVSDTRADGAGEYGYGIEVHAEGRVALERGIISRNRTFGVVASSVGTSVTLVDVVVRDTLGRESDGVGGLGLLVFSGATAEVSRGLFERNREVGIYVSSVGTSVTLTDLMVRDTQGRESDGWGGHGLNVEQGAAVEVSRGLFERNRSVGVLVLNAGTLVTLVDLVVRDTQSREGDGQAGRGLNVEQGAAVEVSRGLFERNRQVGIHASDVGTLVTLADVVVRDTQGQGSDAGSGRGLGVQDGATAGVSRALFERNREFGVSVSGVGTSATLTDLVVRDTQSQESDGAFGRGLSVDGGATVDVSGALVTRNREFGILVLNEGTAARLTDIVVEETAEQACSATTCTEHSFGVGLASVVSATMTATRFAVTDSALCGVLVAANGELDLLTGQVSGSPIGVCLQVEDYVVTRLTEGVRYVGNGTNLDATNLPLPELSEAIGPSPRGE